MREFPAMMRPAEHYPVGSYEWANSMAARLQAASESANRNAAVGVRHLRQIILEISDAKAWDIWPEPPAGTPEDFCQIVCGRSWEGLISELIDRTEHEDVKRQLEWELRRANAEAQNQNRSQGTRTDLLGCNTTKLGETKHGKRSRSDVAHILRRLLRERPDLADRFESGELSANAAAIEAGWRKKPSALDRLIKDWDAASREDQDAFLAYADAERRAAAAVMVPPPLANHARPLLVITAKQSDLDATVRPLLDDPPWANKQRRIAGYTLGGKYPGRLLARSGARVDALKLSDLRSAERCWDERPRCEVLIARPLAKEPDGSRVWASYGSDEERPHARWLKINTGRCDDERIPQIIATLPASCWLAVVDYWMVDGA